MIIYDMARRINIVQYLPRTERYQITYCTSQLDFRPPLSSTSGYFEPNNESLDVPRCI